jgi:hypothetical protein
VGDGRGWTRALRFNRRLVMVSGLLLLAMPPLTGVASVVRDGNDFRTGVLFGLVGAIVCAGALFGKWVSVRRWQLYGNWLHNGRFHVDLSTDPRVQLEIKSRWWGERLALRVGGVGIELGNSRQACYFRPHDLRALAERLRRSTYPHCQAIGNQLELLAGNPSRSSWPARYLGPGT